MTRVRRLLALLLVAAVCQTGTARAAEDGVDQFVVTADAVTVTVRGLSLIHI